MLYSLTATKKRADPRIRTSFIDFSMVSFLVFHFASLHGPAAYITKIGSTQPISLASIGLALFYIAYNAKSASKILRYPPMKWLVALILFAPLLLMTIQTLVSIQSTETTLYYSGLVLMFAFMFVSAAIVGYRCPTSTIVSAILITLILIGFGLILTYQDTNLGRQLAYIISTRSGDNFQPDRVQGFFAHPNDAAISIVVSTLVFCLLYSSSVGFVSLTVLAYSFGLILMTGSRTSIFLLITSVLILVWRASKIEGMRFFVRFTYFIPIAVVALTVIYSVFVSLYSDLPTVANSIERIGNLVGVFSGDRSAQDLSYEIRTRLIEQYTSIVFDHPWLGIGFEGISSLINYGYVEEVSQISWMQWAAEYGLPYSVLMLIAFYKLFSSALAAVRTNFSASVAGLNVIAFSAVLIIATFSLVDIFFYRAIVISFGLLIGRLASSVNPPRLNNSRRFLL